MAWLGFAFIQQQYLQVIRQGNKAVGAAFRHPTL
jgi:hypothetical protein